MFIVLDIETDGQGTFRPPVQRPLEIAWVVCNNDGEIIKRTRRFVSGVERIHPKAKEIHGYDEEFVNTHGLPLKEIFAELEEDARDAELVVGHNIDFDIGCICNQDRLMNFNGGVSLIPRLRSLPLFCTMRHGTDLCRLPMWHGGKGFKWPKLCELADHAGVELDSDKLHGALYDAEITLACYRKLFLS